jgi:hypothetical protein
MEPITLVEVPDQQVLAIRKRGLPYRPWSFLLLEFVFKSRWQSPVCPCFFSHETSKEEPSKDRTGTADVEVAVPVNGHVRPVGEIISYHPARRDDGPDCPPGALREGRGILRRLFIWLLNETW